MRTHPLASISHSFALSCLMCTTIAVNAAEHEELIPYRPSEHPATTERWVTGFTRPAAKLTISAEDSAKLQHLPYEVGMVIGQGSTQTDLSTAESDSSDSPDSIVIGQLDPVSALRNLRAHEHRFLRSLEILNRYKLKSPANSAKSAGGRTS